RIDKLVDNYADRLLRERAETVARTLTIDASAEGQNALWRQAVDEGLLDPQAWLIEFIASEDERTCPICLELDGQRRPLDGTYPGGQGPPAVHSRCRCSEGLVRV